MKLRLDKVKELVKNFLTFMLESESQSYKETINFSEGPQWNGKRQLLARCILSCKIIHGN